MNSFFEGYAFLTVIRCLCSTFPQALPYPLVLIGQKSSDPKKLGTFRPLLNDLTASSILWKDKIYNLLIFLNFYLAIRWFGDSENGRAPNQAQPVHRRRKRTLFYP